MRSILLITAIAATLATASPVRAQPDEYLELSQAGAAASSAGRHDEAYALFQQAHAVFPNARSSRAMAATAFQLRRYAAAIQHYEAALADERRPLTPEQRTQAAEELEVARHLVGRARVVVVTPGATATIDGDDIALDASLVLDPGPHELIVRAPAHVEQQRSFITRAGEEHPFEITLEPVAGARPSVEVREPTVELSPPRVAAASTLDARRARSEPAMPDPEPASSGSILEEWWFWTIVGVVVVGAGVGIGAGVVATSGPSIQAPLVPPSGEVIVALSGP